MPVYLWTWTAIVLTVFVGGVWLWALRRYRLGSEWDRDYLTGFGGVCLVWLTVSYVLGMAKCFAYGIYPLR